MYFKQFYLGCLAHASYLIGSKTEAAVVDPQRDVEQYLKEAEAQGLKIRYVIETHLHADFVSGHRELAERTGAEIVFGHAAGATFPHVAAKDGDELRLGEVVLRILETPGHTPESLCILVIDTAVSDQPQKVLTGDTLFIGDVGRPDLAGGRGYTPQQMASALYDSLHQKLMTLDDAVEVFPAHGAGSMCGRNISSETSSTIGQQRRFNYALQPMSRDEFVELMTVDLPEAPRYFSRDAELNRQGVVPLAEIERPAALSVEEVEERMRHGAVVLDVRAAGAFGAGHVPDSVNIPHTGQFASWAGSLLRPEMELIVVADDEDQVDEAITRLARVGLENVRGFLGEGMLAWDKAGRPLAKVPQMPVDELRARLDEGADLYVLDVRRPPEYRGGHVPGAASVPLAELEQRVAELPAQRTIAIVCQSGFRSNIAASLLARRGFRQLINVVGGTTAWKNAGFAVEPAS